MASKATYSDIYDLFSHFSWAGLLEIDKNKKQIKIAGTDEYILKKDENFLSLAFYDYDEQTKKLILKDGYITLLAQKDLDILSLINYWSDSDKNSHGYNLLREYFVFKDILDISADGITKIKVSKSFKRLQRHGDVLNLPKIIFEDIKNESKGINKRVSSSKNKFLRFLINNSKNEFLNKKIQRTTSTIKGDFDYLVYKFNLTTKKNKKDFQQFLNDDDIKSLGELFESMIKNEVFPEAYIRKLDDYFIKEKLEDIIKNGRKLLALKSDDIKAENAKKVISTLFSQDIRQLETVWQNYFKKYLLYLFFSYKRILPKVELKNLEDLKKQYPDFIGVNHYDGIDVIEIKTHLKNILVWDNSHENFAFSSEMSRAIIQTINYIDAISDSRFKKSKDKKDLLTYLNIDENLYRPKGIIIISSKDKICKNQNSLTEDQKKRLEKDFTKLRNSIHNIQIFTFDEILSIAEKYIENINNKQHAS